MEEKERMIETRMIETWIVIQAWIPVRCPHCRGDDRVILPDLETMEAIEELDCKCGYCGKSYLALPTEVLTFAQWEERYKEKRGIK